MRKFFWTLLLVHLITTLVVVGLLVILPKFAETEPEPTAASEVILMDQQHPIFVETTLEDLTYVIRGAEGSSLPINVCIEGEMQLCDAGAFRSLLPGFVVQASENGLVIVPKGDMKTILSAVLQDSLGADFSFTFDEDVAKSFCFSLEVYQGNLLVSSKIFSLITDVVLLPSEVQF